MQNKKTFKHLLIELNACNEARQWANEKTIEEAVNNCHRGDWLLWLSKNVGMDIQPLTLAKGHCAATVIDLMRDERSKKAVQIAIDFGNGICSRRELDAAYAAAADAYAADAAAYAAAADAYAADAAAKKQNQQLTADICRKYIGNLLVELVNKKLTYETK